MNTHYSVIIIGAGLSGLHSAWQLHKQNKSVLILDARERTGGRMYSPSYKKRGQVDLGPAWVWPQMQPRLTALLDDLNIKTMRQFTQGDKFFQLNAEKIERYNDSSPHAESYRIQGGAQTIAHTLIAHIPNNTFKLNSRVTHIIKKDAHLEIKIDNDNDILSADKIILALPPRVFLQHIKFEPCLPENEIDLLNSIPTWMSTQAKIVVIYKDAFWRKQKLSGEAMSHYGPLSEITDACSEDDKLAALSAFISVNAYQRKNIDKASLINACLNQLQQYFGEQALYPEDVQFKDWAIEPLTCSELDLKTPSQHPQFPSNHSRTLWDGSLILSGSELAPEHGGYLEGALESSFLALQQFRR